MRIEICQLRRAKDPLSRLGKCGRLLSSFVANVRKEKRISKDFMYQKMGRSGFVCYMINNKIKPNEEKNEYKIG